MEPIHQILVPDGDSYNPQVDQPAFITAQNLARYESLLLENELGRPVLYSISQVKPLEPDNSWALKQLTETSLLDFSGYQINFTVL
jgi:hypothetical protein